MEKMIMIKLGGAVLTDKLKPCVIRQQTMEGIAIQISSYLKKNRKRILIGNGGGSFGHYYAEKYGLNAGISDRTQFRGMCLGKNGNAYLNTKLTECLLLHGIDVCSYAVDEIFWYNEDHWKNNHSIIPWLRLFEYLDHGIIPVVYGDIIYDRTLGCKIISTEEIFRNLAKFIVNTPSCGYQLEKIIFCTNRDGVEDLDGNVLHYISRKNFQQWEIFNRDVDGYDVTGGMLEKVKMALDIELKCPVQIINGNNQESLYKALCGDLNQGTIIGE